MKLAERISKIKPSPTLAITSKAKALKAQGVDIISFGAGEPDFDTPLNIKEAAVRAIESGFTKYTPVGGTDELKDAIIEKLNRDNQLTYERSEIVVSCGAKHTLYNLAQVLFEEGDEVIIPAPYWVSYYDIVVLSGASPIVIETRESAGFKIKPDQLEEAITHKTKALILNSPCNPTGAMYTPSELKQLAEVISGKDIFVISDDIYEMILYGDAVFYSIANISEKMKKWTIVVNGVSKTYSMTGWRIGYAAAPQEIVEAITKIQSQSTSNPTSIAQKAAEEALRGNQNAVADMVKEFKKRRDFIVKSLNDIPGISCMNPHGAFYVFPNVSGLYGKSYKGKTVESSTDLAAYLLDEASVAVVPGIAFGNDDHVRLSYATSMEQIEEGMKRIKNAAAELG